MRARGYMIEADYTDGILTVEGTTKAAQIALRGQQRHGGPVTLERADIDRVELKPATRLANGHLDIHTVSGDRYRLHFRRKQADDFTALANALGA